MIVIFEKHKLNLFIFKNQRKEVKRFLLSFNIVKLKTNWLILKIIIKDKDIWCIHKFYHFFQLLGVCIADDNFFFTTFIMFFSFFNKISYFLSPLFQYKPFLTHEISIILDIYLCNILQLMKIWKIYQFHISLNFLTFFTLPNWEKKKKNELNMQFFNQ